MITKRLNDIHDELRTMSEREAMKVWRMARRAEKKGCSEKLVNDIREEGCALYNEYKTYPERLLDWRAKNRLKYAFCGERMKHHYFVINGDNVVIHHEYR